MTDKEILTNIMKATGLNTMQFSHKMGFKRAEKLYRVLRGDNGISPSMREEICKVFNVREDYILRDEEPIFRNGVPKPAVQQDGMFRDCDLFAPVYGDSMAPDYNAGETIACRQVTNLDILPYGEAYYIELKESANGLKVIKLLFPGSDSEVLIARSKNPNFPGDMTIPKKDIERLFLIKGKMTRNIV